MKEGNDGSGLRDRADHSGPARRRSGERTAGRADSAIEGTPATFERHRASAHRSRPVAHEDRPNRRPDRQVEDVLTTMPRTPPPGTPQERGQSGHAPGDRSDRRTPIDA